MLRTLVNERCMRLHMLSQCIRENEVYGGATFSFNSQSFHYSRRWSETLTIPPGENMHCSSRANWPQFKRLQMMRGEHVWSNKKAHAVSEEKERNEKACPALCFSLTHCDKWRAERQLAKWAQLVNLLLQFVENNPKLEIYYVLRGMGFPDDNVHKWSIVTWWYCQLFWQMCFVFSKPHYNNYEFVHKSKMNE